MPPARTPLAILQARGSTLAPHRVEPETEPDDGPRPAMSDAAAIHWDRLHPVVSRMRIMTESDRDSLKLTCEALAIYDAARDAIAENGMTYEVPGKTGTKIYARPEVRIMQDAWQRSMKGLRYFGCNPSDRTKVDVQRDDGPDPLNFKPKLREA